MASSAEEHARALAEIEALQQQVSDLKAKGDALRNENRYLKEIYDRSPLGYQSLDENGCFIDVNQAWLDVLGYTKAEVIGINFGEFLHPDWQEHFRENFPRFKAVGEIMGVEFEIRKKDGHYIFVSFNGRIGTDQQGRFQQTYCIFQDITRQRQAEENYRHIVENAQEAIIVTRDEKLLMVNPAMARMIGLPAEDLETKPFTDFIHPQDRDMVVHYHRGRLQGKDIPVQYTFRVICNDGTIKWLQLHGALTRWDGATAALSFLTDITERKQAEEQLRDNEANLRSLFNAITESVCLIDRDGTVIAANETLAGRIGKRANECVGKSIFSTIPAEIATHRRRIVEEVVRSGKEVQFEDERGDRHFHHNLFPVLTPDGLVTRIAIFASDITERKQSEAEREKLQEQLTQSQKIESIGRLAGGVAHDFNNMLGVILGYTELILDQVEKDQSIRAALKQIQQAAEHSAQLTNKLLAFARKQTVKPKILDLNTIVSGMLTMLRRLIGEDIELIWKPANNLMQIQMDPSQIDQILVNLCVNARDAIEDTGKIVIETAHVPVDGTAHNLTEDSQTGGFVMLTVSDTGCGMDAETISHLFEPFFTTKSIGAGTGLGLATVYGIVKQNNGLVEVSSEPGHGTTFTIYLPCHQGLPAETSVPGEQSPGIHGNETILLVEDEPMILEMTRMILKKLGYHVLAASSPLEAIRIAQERSGGIDLLMTDVIMPEMNGRDLAQTISSLFPHLICLFMSGYTADVIAHHGVLNANVHFIEKPFSKRDLSVKLREILK
ncbi:MAG: PAS domain S-box protein [Desulfofustis sp.]|nr:PAS domain S-box protein [Desulfofustis sp.]